MFPQEREQAVVETFPHVQPGPGSGHAWEPLRQSQPQQEGPPELLGLKLC